MSDTELSDVMFFTGIKNRQSRQQLDEGVASLSEKYLGLGRQSVIDEEASVVQPVQPQIVHLFITQIVHLFITSFISVQVFNDCYSCQNRPSGFSLRESSDQNSGASTCAMCISRCIFSTGAAVEIWSAESTEFFTE